MIYFSQRKKLSDLFKKWCEDNSIMYNPQSMVGWLLSNKCLNEDAVKQLLKGDDDGQKG